MMKMHLPDVNVWVALSISTHKHHPAASAWYLAHFQEGCSFCRLTQQGFLRLVSSERIFGPASVSMTEAWVLYDKIRSNPGVSYVDEPAGIEAVWRAMTQLPTPSTNLWNDAYLAAMSNLTGLNVVSFDTGFRQYSDISCTIL